MSTPPSPICLSWRADVSKYDTPEALANFTAFVREHRAVVDEVAFFETITHHLYLPLEQMAERAAQLARAIRALKAAGVPSVGINVLTTMGHLDEARDIMPPLPFQAMVGHDGKVSTGCGCPNTSECRAYVHEKYRLMAEAGPDFIWVDDDIRMQQHGVAYACFCPACLAIFAKTMGRAYTREELAAALNDPAGDAVRRAWIAQNAETIRALMAAVETTIHGVNPAIVTGLMTAGPGWTTYSGLDFAAWFTALKAVKARPGGGFYSDHARLEILDKAFDMGRQRTLLPATVTDLQYELENFPYAALLKSVGSMMHECTLALAVGLNGIAFNALGMWTPHPDRYAAIPQAAARLRPLWERLVAHTHGLPTAGLWTAWTPHLLARRQVRPGEDWLAFSRQHHHTTANILAQIGLPLSVDQPAATGTVLFGRMAEAFDDGELRAMLAGGVLMDGTALEVLEQRGLGHLTGVRIHERRENGVMERFTDDPFNTPFAGEVRDARIEFWGDARGMGDVLEPTAPGVRVLATMEDYFKRPVGPCLTAHENELGGRVVVMGYAPWMFLQFPHKRHQLQNVVDWLTRGLAPVRIDEAVTLTPIVRLAPDRQRGAVILLNTGLDTIEQATLHLRVNAHTVTLLTADGETPLASTLEPGGRRLALRQLPPWSTTILLLA